MTHADIERMAREAGLYFAKDDFGDVPEVEATHPGSLGRFAELVAAHERERCAVVCAHRAAIQAIRTAAESNAYASEREAEALGCAAAIRAL